MHKEDSDPLANMVTEIRSRCILQKCHPPNKKNQEIYQMSKSGNLPNVKMHQMEYCGVKKYMFIDLIP